MTDRSDHMYASRKEYEALLERNHALTKAFHETVQDLVQMEDSRDTWRITAMVALLWVAITLAALLLP